MPVHQPGENKPGNSLQKNTRLAPKKLRKSLSQSMRLRPVQLVVTIVLLLNQGLLLEIPGPQIAQARSLLAPAVPQTVAIENNVLTTDAFVFNSQVYDYDVKAFLKNQPGPLKDYSLLLPTLKDPAPAGNLIFDNAAGNSLNPQLFLAYIETRTGLISNPNAPVSLIDKIAGNPKLNGIQAELEWLGESLNEAFYSYNPAVPSYYTFLDGTKVEVPAGTNAATYAVFSVLASTSQNSSEWLPYVNASGLKKIYIDYFGQPLVLPTQVNPAAGHPGLKLPWTGGQEWVLTAGLHGAAGGGPPFHAIDWAPYSQYNTPETSGNCRNTYNWGPGITPPPPTRSTQPVLAPHSGKIIYVSSDTTTNLYDVILDYNDGSGWQIEMQHIAPTGKIANQTPVKQGDIIGYPSNCGNATGVHVHFTTKQNSVNQLIGGTVISGWTIVDTGGAAYSSGYMTKNGVNVYPPSGKLISDNNTVVTPPPDVPVDPGQYTVDNGTSDFTIGGDPQYVHSPSCQPWECRGSLTHYTTNATRGVENNYGIWTPTLPQAGTYEVFVSIPNKRFYTPTKGAKYKITFRGGQVAEKVIDQGQYTNGSTYQWVSLGTYDFDGGRASNVKVGDLVPETGSDQAEILMDAVSWKFIAPRVSLPNPPTNLSITPTGSSSMQINWTEPDTSAAYWNVERKTGTGGTWSKIASPAPWTTRPIDDLGLQPNTVYCYRMQAANDAGVSAYTNEVCATTFQRPPDTSPYALTVTGKGSNFVSLSWAIDSKNEDGIAVERKTGAGGTYSEVGRVNKGTTTYQDNGLQPVTTYFYRVRAYNSAGFSSYTQEVSVVTNDSAPAAPSTLNALALSASQIKLTWIRNSNNETGFAIERSLSGITGSFSQVGTAASGSISYTDTGLQPNTTYYYRLKAYNAVGSSSYSNTASATTNNAIPARPTNLRQAAVDKNSLAITWDDNSSNEDQFVIEWSVDNPDHWYQVGTTAANSNWIGFGALSTGRGHYFRVKAVNAVGSSDWSDTALVVTLGLPTPIDVKVLNNSQTSITFAWADFASNESGFKIKRWNGLTGQFEPWATTPTNQNYYTDINLQCGSSYWYQVNVYTTTDESSYSDVLSAQTVDCPPAAPANPDARGISENGIDFSWTDASTNEDNFPVEMREGFSGNWFEIVRAPGNTTGIGVRGLPKSTLYCFRVRAYNAVLGYSDYTQASCATTQGTPQVPTNLTATSNSSSTLTLNWTDNSPTESGFNIYKWNFYTGTFDFLTSVGTNVTTFTDSGLNCTWDYYYEVSAFNTFGESDKAGWIKGTVQGCTATPTNLRSTILPNARVQLQWNDNSSDELYFYVERRTSTSDPWSGVGYVSSNTSAWLDRDALPYTTNYYRVRAYNGAGYSLYSNEVNASTVTIDSYTSVAVSDNFASNFITTAGDNNWYRFTIATSGDYTVETSSQTLLDTYLQLYGPDNYSLLDYNDDSGDGLSSRITRTLSAGIYYAKVRAYNLTDTGSYGFRVTRDGPPATPGNLAGSPGAAGQVNLTWQDLATNENGYRLERTLSSEWNWVEIANLGANSTSYLDKFLIPNTSYSYRIRAYNSKGNSGYTYSDAIVANANRTFTVNTALEIGDVSDTHSLTYALINAGQGDLITFAVPGNKITVKAALPTLKNGVTVVGSSSCATDSIIILDGSDPLAPSTGLVMGGNNQIFGLKLTGFRGKILDLQGKNVSLKCFQVDKKK